MIDLPDIISKAITAGILTAGTFLLSRLWWVFTQTAQNQKDVNAAHQKIRRIMKRLDIEEDEL